MKLDQAQREKVLKWIAAGMKADEINKRAAQENPPFSVTRQMIDKYRRSRGAAFKDIVAKSEKSALKRGLALKEKRVEKLQKLAEKLEHDLIRRRKLWLKDRKCIGSGEFAEFVDYEEFNEAEVRQYRGVLDDIAREMGARSARIGIGDEDDEKPGDFIVIRAPAAKEAS